MKPSIVCYKKLPDELKQKLEKRFTVTAFDAVNDDNFPEFLAALEHAEGLIGSGLTLDRALLQRAPRLRAVSTISAGYDNFDVEALTEKNPADAHPGALTDTVADTIMALVLASGRRIVNVAERVKAGEWQDSVDESWFGVDVHHKTMGIIGMGRIGSALAQRARFGFNMKIVYHTRTRNAEAEDRFDAIYMDLDKLMSTADYVCLILPLSPQTYHLIDAEKLALMKPDAYFINAGRGPVVDEAALIEALQQKKLPEPGWTFLNRSHCLSIHRCCRCLTLSPFHTLVPQRLKRAMPWPKRQWRT